MTRLTTIAVSVVRPELSLVSVLYRYGANRDLHSFPTRRSSDLRTDNLMPPLKAALADYVTIGECCRVLRSEEHTSELQSRQYVVCRLLLEKKRKVTRQFRMSSIWRNVLSDHSAVMTTSSLVPLT